MKLKLAIRAGTEDYSLFRTTLATVSKLRKTCILRFTSSRLIIISTPNSNGMVVDQGQIWCTIPRDVFDIYVVNSIRDDSRIAMECPCETIFGVLRKFEKSNGDELTIKLIRLVGMDADHISGVQANDNTLCGLSFSFQDQKDERNIFHNIKVGVRLLYKTQDEKIVEPTVNYEGILMLQLPSNMSEWGQGFSSWFKRIDRYGNLNALKIHAERVGEKGLLKVVVDEFDWKLDILWKGPLNAMISDIVEDESTGMISGTLENSGSTLSNNNKIANNNNNDNYENYDEMMIEDSDVQDSRESTVFRGNSSVFEKSTLTNAKQDHSHEVIIKARDWKVCSKLYHSFEEVVLVISHDDSCVFHCSLERGVDQDDHSKEKGQIIYYISKCKALVH